MNHHLLTLVKKKWSTTPHPYQDKKKRNSARETTTSWKRAPLTLLMPAFQQVGDRNLHA